MGRIHGNKYASKEFICRDNINFFSDSKEPKKYLQSDDIYKEYRIRGYNFDREFKSVHSVDMTGLHGTIQWKDNWVTFLDSIFQVTLLAKKSMLRKCFLPVRIRELKIQPNDLYKCPSFNTGLIPFTNQQNESKTLTNGVELHDLEVRAIQRPLTNGHLLTYMYVFTPYLNTFFQTGSEEKDKTEWIHSAVLSFIDVFLENIVTDNVRIHNCCISKESFAQDLLMKKFESQPRYRVQIIKNRFTRKMALHDMIPNSDFADLIISDDKNIIKNAAEYLKNSWYLFFQRNADITDLEACFQMFDLHVVAKWTFYNCTVLFSKKIVSNINLNPVGISIDCPTNIWLPRLQSAVKHSHSNSRVYVYSQQSHTSGIIGLVKCLRREQGLETLRCICDPECKLLLNFNAPSRKLKNIFKLDLVMNVYKNGIMGSYRHVPLCSYSLNRPTKCARNSYATTLRTGDLSSLCWIESPLKSDNKSTITAGSQLCNVIYASLNFKDILLATGRLPVTPDDKSNALGYLGMEFSGTNERGDRIMGATLRPALATSILLGPDTITWKIPKWISFEEAATIPIIYLTAYYGLCMRGNLKPGQSVLIHSGTGGVGQAAINIAFSMNCVVYTTVGGIEKQKYLQKLFPSLPSNHVGNSRDTNFEDIICKHTRGRGVDLVLNSLIEEKLITGLRCVASGGTFIEIGKHDIYQNTNVGLGNLKNQITFHVVDPMHVIKTNKRETDCMRLLVQNGLTSSTVKPLRPTVFCKSKIEEAFRFMSSGNHVDKVLINLQSCCIKRKPKATFKTMPRTYFSPKKIYIILGGLSGLGLEVANWMALRGAKHLALLSRSEINNGYQRLLIKRLEASGVQVDIYRTDLSCYKKAYIFIQAITKAGKSVGGFFNSGLVICDAILANQTAQTYKNVELPKNVVTRNIDRLSRHYCYDMDYFVAFSSLVASIGNPGQSNYGKANSAMEQICIGRKGDGMHALAIQWGPVGDVGFAAEKMEVQNEFKDGIPQRISSCLEVLDTFLEKSKRSSIVCFSSIVTPELHSDQKNAQYDGILLTDKKLCSIQKSLQDIDSTTTLGELGLDSLSISALQLQLEREYGLQLSKTEITDLTWREMISFETSK